MELLGKISFLKLKRLKTLLCNGKNILRDFGELLTRMFLVH